MNYYMLIGMKTVRFEMKSESQEYTFSGVGENSARKRIRITHPGEFGPHSWRTRATTL